MTETTLIDVLDTAVKVGLGALIGFGGTFVLEWIRSKREKKNKKREERKNLLIKTAEYLDSGMNSAACCSQAFKQRLGDSEFTAVDKELEANNFFGKAETYAQLAECPEIAKKISELKGKFLECFKNTEPPVFLSKVQTQELNRIADEAYKLLSSSFANL